MTTLLGRSARGALAGVLACCAVSGLGAQGNVQVYRSGQNAPSPATYDSTAFAALKWRDIGPFRGGRSVAVAGSAARPNEYYFGSTGGGVFKTTDAGLSWSPVTDKYFGGTIGAVAVSESNPDIVYVGAGEADIRGNVSHGDGMFKSTDAGKTWTSIGLTDSRHISRVRIDPRDPNVVYVGVLGHVWGPNSERGVYKTTDGGKSWKRVLFRNDSTGVTDLIIDPSNPDILYAALWQMWRTPWKLVSGGAGSGLFKSTDGGEHWTEITRNTGLPSGIIGNIGLAVSPANHNRVWALVEADSGGLFRSDDGGATWTKLNSDASLRQRAWYFSRIFADPKDTNTVYALNVEMFRSKDGGKTFKRMATPHSDNHEMWIAPNDPNRMIESNDGGATISFNGGKSWSSLAQPTAQFYHVETTNDFPYRVCGAQQDNSTLCGPSRKRGGIDISDWYSVGGGESGYIAVRPDSPNVVFAGSYNGRLTIMDVRTRLMRNVNPWPDNPMGHSAGDIKYRFQWTYPIVLSPHDPKTIYTAAQYLFRSTDDGNSWQVISPDLTRHDPRTLGPSGGPITKDQTSVEYYGTLFAVAESPVAKGELWTGSDDGLISLSRDNGKTWQNVTPPGLPAWTRISIIEPSHFDAGTAYVAANHYQRDDLRPYLYKTTDYGKTWTKITNGIPETEFTRAIREDPARRGLLYASTERSVYVSFDDGAQWQSLKLNLPPVPVHDLAVKDGDLVAATHGRGFWILDDLSPLRQLTPAIVASTAHLFKPREVNRASFGGGASSGAVGGTPSAASARSGAVIYYWLKSPHQTVTLDFLDVNGKVIQSFTSKQDSAEAADSVRKAAAAKSGKKESGSAGSGRSRTPRVPDKAGLNVFTWNLRYPGAVTFKNIVLWAGTQPGPMIVPGTYTVRMTVDGQSQTQSFTVVPDPRAHATQQQYQEQFTFLMKVRDTLSAANNAVRTIRNVRTQIEQSGKKLPSARLAEFQRITKPFVDSLTRIEETIYQVRSHSGEDPLNFPVRLNDKIAHVAADMDNTDSPPTQQAYAVFDELSAQLTTELKTLHSTMQGLTPVNAFLKRAGIAAIVPSTAELNTNGNDAGDSEDEPPDEF